ncbi:MAG TPA: hypothetical protein VH352_27295 [Pseudonocardiaceae bacterium]|nr:hypothetical protein [Pseudonocardiaceae bacterium]
MSLSELPDRDDVLAMLASYGDRRPQDVNEELGSLELTWLVAQAEQRYAVVLDLSDDVFARMATVTGAVDVLRTEIAEQVAGDRDVASSGVSSNVEAGHG